MKKYNELLNENLLLSSPLLRMAGLRGAYKAVESLVRDVVYHGAKFIARNPHLVIAGAIVVDYTILDQKMTKAIINYFEQTFPGHAMYVYRALKDISVENEAQPMDVAKMFAEVMNAQTKENN